MDRNGASSTRDFMEDTPSRIARKDFLSAAMASLALHAAAILLAIVAGSAISIPARQEKMPELTLSLVNLSSSPSELQPSRLPSPGARPNGPTQPEVEQKKAALPDGHTGEQLPSPPLPRDRRKIRERADSRAGQVIASFGADLLSRKEEREGPAPAPAEASVAATGSGPGAAAETAEGAAAGGKGGGAPPPSAPGPQSGRGGGSPGAPGPRTGRAGGASGPLRSSPSRYSLSPPPVYPEAARQKGHEGLVLVSVEILETGTPGRLIVKKSSGYDLLDQAALQAVKKWKFTPAVQNNVRIRTWGDVPIRFVLQEPD